MDKYATLAPRGTVTFRGLELAFGTGAFHPQPETESIVDWILKVPTFASNAVVVDLCSGCGTVALGIAAGVPASVTVHAVEKSLESFVWLERNIATSGVPVIPHLDDAATALSHLDGSVDLVVSNPPYVATAEIPLLAGTVAAHDPAISLHGGDDGLDIVRMVVASAARLLRPGGILVVEHSDRQGQSAPALLRRDGRWDDVEDHRDYEGKDRFMTARLRVTNYQE